MSPAAFHAVSVQIVNDIFAERIREEAERQPVSDLKRAQPQSKARASSQGPAIGVQHQKILAGRLRDQARHADSADQERRRRARLHSRALAGRIVGPPR